MRRWLWSVIMAIIGFFLGLWWLREREVTKPALTRTDVPPKRMPAQRGDVESGAGKHAPNGASSSVKADAPQPAAEEAAEPVADAVETAIDERDSLTDINGIGPAFETALNAIGIYTYTQLAEQDAESLAKQLDARGVTAERIERDGWIEQARAMSRKE